MQSCQIRTFLKPFSNVLWRNGLNVIETRGLTKIYENRLVALNTVTIDIAQGTVLGLIGPNGAGKSTALMLFLGMQTATAGSISVFGQPMSLASGDLRKRIGFLPQTGAYPPDMTPITYLDQVGMLFGIPKQLRKQRIAALLHATDMLQASAQRIDHLSSGQRTRMGIAAALINDPELLLLDEPTVGLDPEGRSYTLSLIKDLKRRGRTIILATHILPDADQVCDRVAVLNHGKLVYHGTVADMKQIAYHNTVDIMVDGTDIPSALQSLAMQFKNVEFDQSWHETIRVYFGNRAGDFAVELGVILGELSRHELVLRSVRQVGELEDALIQRLGEDRMRGFARGLDEEVTLIDLLNPQTGADG